MNTRLCKKQWQAKEDKEKKKEVCGHEQGRVIGRGDRDDDYSSGFCCIFQSVLQKKMKNATIT